MKFKVKISPIVLILICKYRYARGCFLCGAVVKNIVRCSKLRVTILIGAMHHLQIFSFLRAVTSLGLFMRFGYHIYDQEHSRCLVMTQWIVVWPLLTSLIP